MLKIQELEKHYHNFHLHCSLHVPKGHVSALIGANGSGKTTTFKAALGLIHKDGGSATFFDKEVEILSPAEKEQLGVVLADAGFNRSLTPKDLIPVQKALYQHFDEAFFISKLEDFALPLQKPIKTFSTGMQAKLKVLIALAHHAKLLILDEPTAGLDMMARDEILDLLRDYMAQDPERSILMSSHISSDLERFCDDLYLIDSGKIIFHEDTDVILSDYAVLKVTEKDHFTLDTSHLLRWLKKPYGHALLTNEKAYYKENYPQLVIENASVDDVMRMMIRGEKI